METVFNPENLKRVIEASGMTVEGAAKACDIPKSSMRYYLKGVADPSLKRLMAIADFFAVPLDYLVGRLTEEEAALVLDNYADHFKTLRKSNYESLMFHKAGVWPKPDGYEAPYPYNLLDDIFQKPFDHLLTDDERAGIEMALNTLTDKEKAVILTRYQDEETLYGTGQIFGLTPERIRQIQAKALRKLRHPARRNLIVWGEDGYSKKKELDLREYKLNAWEESLQEREELFEAKVTKNERAIEAAFYDTPLSHLASQAFEDLDLSVRAYNCLRRAKIATVSDIVEHFHDGSITEIRNLGFKSIEEICRKVMERSGIGAKKLLGENYDELCKLDSYRKKKLSDMVYGVEFRLRKVG